MVPLNTYCSAPLLSLLDTVLPRDLLIHSGEWQHAASAETFFLIKTQQGPGLTSSEADEHRGTTVYAPLRCFPIGTQSALQFYFTAAQHSANRCVTV